MSNQFEAPLMSAAQDYYEQVLALGYPPVHAFAYTRQHYPEFIPDASKLSDTPPPNQPEVNAGSSPVKAYAAVALLLIGALLSVAAQFNHEWMAMGEDNKTIGLSAGLSPIRANCAEAVPLNGITQADATDQCKAMAYVWFADDMEAAAAENKSVDELDVVFVSSHENFCKNIEMFLENYALILFVYDTSPNLDFQRWALVSSQRICSNVGYYVEVDSWNEDLSTLDESRTGLILGLGSITALLGTGLLATTAVGRELPGNIERLGKWAGFAAGVMIIAALLLFGADTSPHLFGTKIGKGAYMALLGGVLSIVAGVLAYMDQK